jgi:hypothetical protein
MKHVLNLKEKQRPQLQQLHTQQLAKPVVCLPQHRQQGVLHQFPQHKHLGSSYFLKPSFAAH